MARDSEAEDRTVPAFGSVTYSFRWRLSRITDILRGFTIDVEPHDSQPPGPLISFLGVEVNEEADRYWVNAPDGFISINHDPDSNEYLYVVVEPDLSEFEAEILEQRIVDLTETLIYEAEHDPEVAESILKSQLRELPEQYGVEIEMNFFYRLYGYLYRTFEAYERIDPLMHDPNIEDVSCDGYEFLIFVYHDKYTEMGTNPEFAEGELDDFVIRLAQTAIMKGFLSGFLAGQMDESNMKAEVNHANLMLAIAYVFFLGFG